jgi:hypothetical protein
MPPRDSGIGMKLGPRVVVEHVGRMTDPEASGEQSFWRGTLAPFAVKDRRLTANGELCLVDGLFLRARAGTPLSVGMPTLHGRHSAACRLRQWPKLHQTDANAVETWKTFQSIEPPRLAFARL